MKRTYFIKHDQRIRRIIGCDRATLIFDRLEFYSSRQPDGFYKFIEPNSHRLYKEDDSWTELLGCHRTSFWRAFKLIGKKHSSRWTFEQSEDKFDGKLYASYYDRLTNRMFFVRNHDVVKELLAKIQPGSELGDKSEKFKDSSQSCPGSDKTKNSLRTEQNAQSYKESKPSSLDLFLNKSHAEEIIKKMIEIWTALVEEGKGLVKLSKTTIPFLKKAFTDKFDNCLEKWKKYCYDIASSRFLMGEKTSWKADLDWALMFKNIEKVLDGQYGIGDRTPKAILASQADLQEEILASKESQEIKDFRILCLKTVGNGKYVCWFKNLTIEFREEGEIALISAHRFGADYLGQHYYSYLQIILQELEKKSKRISILAHGETRGRVIEPERGGDAAPSLPTISTIEHPNDEEFPMEETISKDESQPEISLETKVLREKLRNTIPPQQFPSWLGSIEVEDIEEDGTVVVTFEDQHIVDYCRVHFRQQILACANELWQNAKYLIIQEKAEGLNGFEPIPFQDMVQKNKNIPGYKSLQEDADFLMNMVGCKGEGATSKDEPLPEVSLETQTLRTKLRNTIPPKQFPSWLGSIEVEDIEEDGTVVVTFEDQHIVDYCKVRFSQEILLCATSLWKDINKIAIRQKLANGAYSSVENPLENSQEKSTIGQALQSLMLIGSAMKSVGTLGTREACPAFA